MTSATERLRALLDERGVEWWEEDGHTLWYGESIHHAASAFSSFMFGENERVHLNAMVTPEQAIAATLGRGTCQMDAYGNCTACGEFVAKSWEYVHLLDGGYEAKPCTAHNYCPNCGRKVVC